MLLFGVPWSMTHIGPSGTMLIAAGIAGLGAALRQWLAPETNDKGLPETAAGIAH